jgi:hypothetical protein
MMAIFTHYVSTLSVHRFSTVLFVPKVAVLGGCFAVMTWLAQRLPIALVIEQGKIAFMGIT